MKEIISKLKTTTISKSYMFILFGVTTLMLTGYFSYAWFTVQGVQKYSVVTGTLSGSIAIGTNSVAIEGVGAINYTPTTDNDTITLTVTNTNDRTVKNAIYYYNLTDTFIEIGYTSDSPTVPTTQGVSVAQNKTLTYKIKIKNAKGKQIKIGSSMGLNNSNLTLPSGTTAFSLLSDPPAAEVLVAKANPEDLDYNKATTAQKNQMWAFSHEATEQLGATTDYRYIGANPNNYVKFNDELWRIIGVFDTDDGTGKVEKRMKIIRNESIGNYAWNYTSSGVNTNRWETAQLNTLLNNGAYYNRTTGSYNNTNVDFTSTGLTDLAKEMIEDAKWYLGPNSRDNDITAQMFYVKERGTSIYSDRRINWVGKVGLIYSSDYGYATSGNSSTTKETCLAQALYYWYYTTCNKNDFLSKSGYMWSLSTHGESGDSVFAIDNGTSVFGFDVPTDLGVYPTVYLKSTISITSGTGSSTDPFILAQS